MTEISREIRRRTDNRSNKMLNKDLVHIEEVDKGLAKSVIESNHYSHKIPQAIKYRFGLFYDNELKGVVIFSVPANMHTFTSVFHEVSQHVGLELSRVYTSDDTPANFESYCLSRCLKYIEKRTDYDVVVSYADPNFGHAGYLYQALNAWYLGETNSEVRYLYKGQLITRRGLGRRKGDSEKAHRERIMADGAKRVKMKGKHKYIFFTCNKRKKRELMSLIKDKVNISKNYPKIEEFEEGKNEEDT